MEYLDEQGEWAVILDDGLIVHVHDDATEDDADELLLYECEETTDTDGLAVARCSECGATIPVADLEALVDQHPNLTRQL